MTAGKIHSFETFGAADGPGVRFIVFLSGCPLRCAYCHNPDTWARPPALEMTADEVWRKALRYRSYWGAKGGLTVSGGEPLLQLGFLRDLFTLAKKAGVSTCIDTSGAPFTQSDPAWLASFAEVMSVTDLVLLDIKAFDRDRHVALTGQPNDSILDCARYLDEIGKDVWIRHVFVPGVTDADGDTERIASFLRTLRNVRRTEVLPYHTFGVSKWHDLGLPYRLDGVNPPSAAETGQVAALMA